MIDDSNEFNFPQKLLLTDRQVLTFSKAFANHLLANIKLSKIQLSKIVQSRKLIGMLLGPALKSGLRLMKNVLKPLAKSVLIPLELTASALVADAGIHNNLTILESLARQP